jgi:hypothetical protein
MRGSWGSWGSPPDVGVVYEVEKCMGLDRVFGDATLFGLRLISTRISTPKQAGQLHVHMLRLARGGPSLRSLGLESIFDPPLRLNVQVGPGRAYW